MYSLCHDGIKHPFCLGSVVSVCMKQKANTRLKMGSKPG